MTAYPKPKTTDEDAIHCPVKERKEKRAKQLAGGGSQAQNNLSQL